MKFTIALTTLTVLTAKVSAACFSENLGYKCCKGNTIYYTDNNGAWGIENGEWCGIENGNKDNLCFSVKLGFKCCKGNNIIYTDKDGDWGVEDDEWCGISNKSNNNNNSGQGGSQSSSSSSSSNTYPYPLKNDPVPSKGCGKNLSLPKTGSFEFNWSGGKRTVRIDLPDNYDNKKPYRLVFGMQCAGGWAGGVQQEGYYGLKPLDTGKTTIFIAPEGNGQQLPWGEADYKLFDELLDKLTNDLCIDISRVFSTGFSYGAMFSNGLSWNHQKVLRGVAVYETAERNIYLPKHTGDGIGWMGVLGFDDNICTPEMGRHARDIMLEHNSEGGKAVQEKAEEASRGGAHKCYDYKTTDEKFPVRWCTQSGGHLWDHKDPGQNQSWVPKATWEFITKF
ncbi:hypothetical protein BCR32DRAFT_326481 [Anaeromyces robustus]|uniref:feruloyl esterase n=1 Tax=Anaeromyces robustus TaxID=1754192 RepID=A0A1Y1XBU9_9FUNG|nr:hypothetical protein BCR32DRAFT_326481 [Anaeromyces robustus]|eukprot:ORX83240.1 hypothetical protein BCR32DRAFT_326481 [Anaeromyces robustus]